jgi:hypothetical protein
MLWQAWAAWPCLQQRRVGPTSNDVGRRAVELSLAKVDQLDRQAAVELAPQHHDGDGCVRQHVPASGDDENPLLLGVLLAVGRLEGLLVPAAARSSGVKRR